MFFENTIVKVAYISRRSELWIEFAEPIKNTLSYTCACFVNVPTETVKRFKNAENRDEFFHQHIRKKFKHYLTIFELCEVFLKKDKKTASDVKTYAEYEEKLKAELQKKELDAMQALL